MKKMVLFVLSSFFFLSCESKDDGRLTLPDDISGNTGQTEASPWRIMAHQIDKPSISH